MNSREITFLDYDFSNEINLRRAFEDKSNRHLIFSY